MAGPDGAGLLAHRAWGERPDAAGTPGPAAARAVSLRSVAAGSHDVGVDAFDPLTQVLQFGADGLEGA